MQNPMFKGMSSDEINQILALVFGAYVPSIKRMVSDFSKVSDFHVLLSSPHLCLYSDVREVVKQILALYKFYTELNEKNYLAQFVVCYEEHYQAKLISVLKEHNYEIVKFSNADDESSHVGKLLQFPIQF